MAQETATLGLLPWIEELSAISGEQERREFVASRAEARSPEAIQNLYDAVVTLVRVDVPRAERLAHASAWIAAELNDAACIAQSTRAVGHVLYITGKYKQAIQHYERAMAIFEELGRDVDVART